MLTLKSFLLDNDVQVFLIKFLSWEQSIGSLQKKYSIGSFELLSKTAPIQAISLLIFGPFVDYFLSGRFITTYKMTYGAVVSIPKSHNLVL